MQNSDSFSRVLQRNFRNPRGGFYYLLVVPSLVLVCIFSYFPTVSAVFHSFFEWGGGDSKEWIGLDNFSRLLTDEVFWSSFGTITILILANVVKLIPSITIAVLIHRVRSADLQYGYRVMVVLPMIVPALVTLFLWKFFFDPNIGALNAFLDLSGGKSLLVSLDEFYEWGVFRDDQPIGWLSTPALIIPSLIFWGFPWLGSVGVLIYLAGLQAIDRELYEAASIDGCGPWRQFVFIELPLITTQIRLTLILLVIGTMQGYGTQLLLLGENGGAGGAGMVPGLWMFNRAFFAGEMGYACSLGVVLFFFILTLTWINNRFVRVEK